MGALEGNVTIPKVGAVPKRTLVLVGGAAAAFVGWRYYVARSGVGDGTGEEEPSDFADGGLPPGVIGAVDPGNNYGGDTGDTGDVGNGNGGVPTTNAQWANTAATQLSQSETWSYTDIVTALGAYLGGIPLTAGQQAIVRAAIAIAGYPPVGTHSIVPGGNTGLIVAPSGFKVTPTGPSTVTLSASPVAGAASYRIYRDGTIGNQGKSSSPSFTIGKLTPGNTYTWHMRAVSSSGEIGPATPSVSGKQPAGGVTGQPVGGGAPTQRLKKANAPRVSSVSASSAKLSTAAVAGATRYAWYVDGVPHGVSTSPSNHTVAGLKGKSTHYATVSAHADGKAGALSNRTTFKTK